MPNFVPHPLQASLMSFSTFFDDKMLLFLYRIDKSESDDFDSRKLDHVINDVIYDGGDDEIVLININCGTFFSKTIWV